MKYKRIEEDNWLYDVLSCILYFVIYLVIFLMSRLEAHQAIGLSTAFTIVTLMISSTYAYVLNIWTKMNDEEDSDR